MKLDLFGRILAAAFVLAAPIAAQAQDAEARPAIVLATSGIDLRDTESGKTDTVGFDTDQDTVVEAIGTALGAPTGSELNSECGAGTLQAVKFQGGLQLYFKAGKFVGWEASDGSGYSSANGIRIGMTQSALQSASKDMEGEESTLGYEFIADGFSGLLSDGSANGRITTIWAGTTCTMR